MSAIRTSLIIFLFALTGCASTSAPRGWLPDPVQTQSNVYGGWVVANIDSAGSEYDIRGELIAVEIDTVFILSYQGLHAAPRSLIRSAKVAFYDGNYQALRGWTLAGTLSTLSHGFFLLISAPLWILTGSITIAAATHDQIVEFPDRSWETIKIYSRFPQGLPANIDRMRMTLK